MYAEKTLYAADVERIRWSSMA